MRVATSSAIVARGWRGSSCLRSSVIVPMIGCRWMGGNSRKTFEETQHLARGLSKFDIPPATKRKWQKQIGKRQQKESSTWQTPPLELNRALSYEAKALKEIHRKSYGANVLLEIRDVRLPSSTHHPSFTRLARHRRHLICYTHADMIDAETRDKVEQWTLDSWPDSRPIFVDTREHRPDVMSYQLVYDSLLKHLDEMGGDNVALTVGVPNTGKSSLLMALLRLARSTGEIGKALLASPVKTSRKKKKNQRRLGKMGAPPIEDKPGKTRVLTEYVLRDKPRAYFLDVPGMSPPPAFFEERPEAWFGYVASNLLPISKDLQTDAEAQVAICDYVLRCLNRDNNFAYVIKAGLEDVGPTNNINDVLMGLKKRWPRRDNQEEFVEEYVSERLQLKRCKNFLKFYNTGNLGSVVLDDIRKPYKPFVFRDSHFNRKRSEKEEGNVDDYEDYDDWEEEFETPPHSVYDGGI